MPELEHYMLALLRELDDELRAAADDFDFNTYTRALTDFCNEDLSAFFFDIRKDCLYCDAAGRSEAPRLSHRARHAVPRAGPLCRAGAGVHRRGSVEHALSRGGERPSAANGPTLPEWPHADMVDSWDELRALRERVNEAIEPLRRDKTIGSSLEAEVTVPAERMPEDDDDLAELFITATVTRGARRRCDRVPNHPPQMRPLLAPSARRGGRRRICAVAAMSVVGAMDALA